jgi:hypothetical protein
MSADPRQGFVVGERSRRHGNPPPAAGKAGTVFFIERHGTNRASVAKRAARGDFFGRK